ncbi:MAG: helix-turn-helix domain-containing protein [Hyphomicrobiales bacterium]|nr:helix-turn-helix domain-containing protein [Hyphomicrobiales bacterium]
MAGLSRFIAVLRLFDTGVSGNAESWTVAAMATAMGVPASTLYRTVRELTKAGFLEQSGEAGYRLGPAFIEFERLLRLNDPLVRFGHAVIEDVLRQAGMQCIVLMARLYNGEVMCVADEAAPGTAFRSSYERGRPMPMTRGATSKVILANLPSRELSRLIGPRSETVELRKELQNIRRAGFMATASEIDRGLAGIAAPVVVPEAGITASLTLVCQESVLDEASRRRLVLLVVSAASLLAEDIRRTAHRPPPAAPASKSATSKSTASRTAASLAVAKPRQKGTRKPRNH